MRRNNSFEGITLFVAVGRCLSFTAAAKQLSMSPSAASQAVRNLEERLGTLLLQRTTRSIRLTDAGSDFLAAIAPALDQLERATQDTKARSLEPSGRLRLILPRAAFEWRIAPLLKDFLAAYPNIVVELAVEGRLDDIVVRGVDAGIRYGPLLEPDMVAVKIAGSSESIVVASPAYLSSHPKPSQPSDLTNHVAIIGCRERPGYLIPWDLQRGKETLQVLPTARVIVQDLVSEIELVVRGIGIGCVPSRVVADQLQTGKLIRLLESWSVPLGSLFLFFPGRRHKSAALRAFIEFLRAHPDTGVDSSRT